MSAPRFVFCFMANWYREHNKQYPAIETQLLREIGLSPAGLRPVVLANILGMPLSRCTAFLSRFANPKGYKWLTNRQGTYSLTGKGWQRLEFLVRNHPSKP